MGMFDSQSKILKEFKHNMQMKVYEEDYLQNGIPQSVFIKRLAKKSYEELPLNDFNEEYPKYEENVIALVKKGDIWKTGLERLLLPEKGKQPPVVQVAAAPKQAAMPVKEKVPAKNEHVVLSGQEDVSQKKGAPVPIMEKPVAEAAKPVEKTTTKPKPKKKVRVVLTLGVMLSTFAIGSVIGVLLRHNGF